MICASNVVEHSMENASNISKNVDKNSSVTKTSSTRRNKHLKEGLA